MWCFVCWSTACSSIVTIFGHQSHSFEDLLLHGDSKPWGILQPALFDSTPKTLSAIVGFGLCSELCKRVMRCGRGCLWNLLFMRNQSLFRGRQKEISVPCQPSLWNTNALFSIGRWKGTDNAGNVPKKRDLVARRGRTEGHTETSYHKGDVGGYIRWYNIENFHHCFPLGVLEEPAFKL